MEAPKFRFDPLPITADQLWPYYDQWKQTVQPDDAKSLQACFFSSKGIQNYVFLPMGMARELMANAHTTHVQVAFVVVACTDGTQAFSVAFLPIDDDGTATSDTYYLAGVADLPAQLEVLPPPPPNSPHVAYDPISTQSAEESIQNWAKQAEHFSRRFFLPENSPELGPLCGYTFKVDDFRNSFPPSSSSDDSLALWLNFALHDIFFGFPPPEEVIFSFFTTLCRNAMPVPGTAGEIYFTEAQHYKDLSKPCPPFCHVIAPAALPARSH